MTWVDRLYHCACLCTPLLLSKITLSFKLMSFPGHRALEKYVFWNMILNNIHFASSLTLSKTYIWQQDTERTQGWEYVSVQEFASYMPDPGFNSNPEGNKWETPDAGQWILEHHRLEFLFRVNFLISSYQVTRNNRSHITEVLIFQNTNCGVKSTEIYLFIFFLYLGQKTKMEWSAWLEYPGQTPSQEILFCFSLPPCSFFWMLQSYAIPFLNDFSVWL